MAFEKVAMIRPFVSNKVGDYVLGRFGGLVTRDNKPDVKMVIIETGTVLPDGKVEPVRFSVQDFKIVREIEARTKAHKPCDFMVIDVVGFDARDFPLYDIACSADQADLQSEVTKRGGKWYEYHERPRQVPAAPGAAPAATAPAAGGGKDDLPF